MDGPVAGPRNPVDEARKPAAHGAGRLPILVGVTGKRSLAADPALHASRAAEVHRRLVAIFRDLDRRFPDTPKVLLSGGAAGVDLVAARAALDAGQRWLVTLVLPFAPELFAHDFIGRPGELAALQTLLDQADPADKARRVMVKVLPPLADEHGVPVAAERLDKTRQGADVTLRRAHYEQVGQFIAETALLMIAVVAGPEDAAAEATGGTARIAAYRRAGEPDAAGLAVARRSTVLRHAWDPAQIPPGGFVWLIDAALPAPRKAWPDAVLHPWPRLPPADIYRAWRDHVPPETEPADPLTALARAAASRLRAARLGWHPGPDGFQESLSTMRGLYLFKQARASLQEPEPAESLLAPIADPLAYIPALRQVIGEVQGLARRQTDRALIVVTAAFAIAVAALETFGELMEDSSVPLWVYFVMLVFGLAWVLFVRARQWQARTEDYRAVAEMLRVQRSWWAAGLPDRVDRFHLQGAGRELARVRDVGGAVIAWIWLRSRWPGGVPPSCEPAIIRQAGPRRPTEEIGALRKSPRDWIGGQIWYFATKSELRERKAALLNTASWALFAVSVALSMLLLGWLTWPGWQDAVRQGAAAATIGDIAVTAPAAWLAAALACFGLRLVLCRMAGWTGIAATALTGLVASCCLGAAIVLVAGEEAGPATVIGGAVREYAVFAFVLLTAAAGALRFLTEKLGIEQEAVAYKEALGRYERAEALLAALGDPATAPEADRTRYRDIVRDLGVLSLRENEFWLKARRERPISPVMG